MRGGVDTGTPASLAANAAISNAASGWAKAFAALPICVKRARSRKSSPTVFTRRSLVSYFSGMSNAAPARASASALRNW